MCALSHTPRFLFSFLFLALFVISPYPVHGSDSDISVTGVFAHTNVERYRAGVPLFVRNTTLDAIAYRKMVDMFTREYFAHEAPTGEDVAYLADSAGYAYLSIGENLALGTFRSSGAIVRAWMESPGHKANILNQKYSEIGVAVGQGRYKGKRMWIAVQTFGLPRSSCPEPDSVSKEAIDASVNTLSFLQAVLAVRERGVHESSLGRSVYMERVESYNAAIALYNKHVRTQRALVKEYNESVRLFNECIALKTG